MDIHVLAYLFLDHQVGHDKVLVSTSLPDHSLLSWKLEISSFSNKEEVTNNTNFLMEEESRLKYNV